MVASPFIGAGGEWSAANSITVTGAGVTIPIDTEKSAFGGVISANLSTFEFTFLVPGFYDVVATWVLNQVVTATRSTLRGNLQENIAGGGFTDITEAEIFTYSRTAAQGEGAGSVKITRHYAPGDIIRSRGNIHVAAPSALTDAGTCNLSITYRSAS